MVADHRLDELEARVTALEGAVNPPELRPRERRFTQPVVVQGDVRSSGPPPQRPAAERGPSPRDDAPPARRSSTPGRPAAERGPSPRDDAPPARRSATLGSLAPKRDLEDFVGANVLAWLGGVAVLAGLAFLLTMAVSRGWIGEGARTAMAGVLSLGLLGVGVWLREQRGAYEAALAAAAVGVAGSFGTLFVAGPVYDLLPGDVALLGALAVGGAATALSIRWKARIMGWLGLLGALWAPAVLGNGDGSEHVFLVIAYTASIAVLVWRRWTVLAGFVFASATLLWAGFVAAGSEALALSLYGVLAAALAFGFEANRRGVARVEIGPEARTRTSVFAVCVLVISAILLALAGWFTLDGEQWLTALAIAHIAAGLGAIRFQRISREFALITLAIGIVLANIAFASIASGLPLVIGWGLSAVPFAALLGARRPGHDSRLADLIVGRPHAADRILALAGLASQLSLAIFQAVGFDAHPAELAGPLASDGALGAAAALAVVAWTCGRLVGPGFRSVLDVLALAALAHFTGLALEGAALTVTLAAQALGLATLARHTGDRIVGWAAVAFTVTALLHALGTVAEPFALYDGLDDPFAAAGALLAVAGAFWAVARVPLGDEEMRPFLLGAAALVLLYLGSVEAVSLAGGGLAGQTALSVLWAVAGVGALVAGLVADDRVLRRAALGLLALTVTKVFLYDLASLTSMYRVGSLIGLGLLLLCGAFAWQKVRPQGSSSGLPLER